MLGYYSSLYYYVTSEHPSQMYTIISLVVIYAVDYALKNGRKKKKEFFLYLIFVFKMWFCQHI